MTHAYKLLQSNSTIPKGRIDKHFSKGVLFITYSLLVSNSKLKSETEVDMTSGVPVDKQMNDKIAPGSRLEQIVDWLKDEEAPLIVLDECHKAKNLVAATGGKAFSCCPWRSEM